MKVVQTAQRPLLGIAGLVLIIVVALISLKSLKAVPAGAAGATGMMSLPRNEMMSSGMHAAALQQPPMPVVLPTNTMRDKVNSTIEQQPEVAARVVRAWLKEV